MEFWKIGLAAGAAWLGYEYLTGGLTSAVHAVTGTATQTSVAPSGVVTSTPVSSVPSVTSATLTTKAGQATQNIYQWNYWYAALTGKPNADVLNTTKFPVDGNTVMDAQTYLNYLSQLGLSGIRGLGMIINLQSLFSGRTDPTGFGDEEFRAGLGIIENEPANSAAYVDVQPLIDGAMFKGSLDASTQVFYDAVKG